MANLPWKRGERGVEQQLVPLSTIAWVAGLVDVILTNEHALQASAATLATAHCHQPHHPPDRHQQHHHRNQQH